MTSNQPLNLFKLVLDSRLGQNFELGTEIEYLLVSLLRLFSLLAVLVPYLLLVLLDLLSAHNSIQLYLRYSFPLLSHDVPLTL